MGIVEFKFPDVGEGIAEGEIVRWLVRAGEWVEAHQPIVEMETDKAVVELPSPVAGTVRELRGEPGSSVAVGKVLAVIEGEGAEPPVAEERPLAVGVVGVLEEAGEKTERKREVLALPKERKLAKKLGVDILGLSGTGRGGRVTDDEIRKAAEAESRGGEPAERIPLKGVARSMARTMAAAASAVPVTIMEAADAFALRELREREKALAEKRGVSLSYLPFILKALCAVLERHPLLNSTFDEQKEEVLLRRDINIGFAVDTREGLLVPVLHLARRKSILELAVALHALADRARQRKLVPEELKGGTFTLSNYGALGGTWGTPVITPGQSAILGLGRIADSPVVRDGQLAVRPVVPFSLSFDHRIIDGATAQRFLNDLIEHIENPDLILLET